MKKWFFLTVIFIVLAYTFFIPDMLFGEDSFDNTINNLDLIWIVIAAALVFFMQAGFAMIEAGFTRAKNAGNIMMKNLMDFSVGTIVYWAVGFGIMFGTDKIGLFGTTGFLLGNINPMTTSGIKKLLYWFFQVMFTATSATIVSGAVAERTKFTAYLLTSVIISSFIYPVVGHWIWGGGWLQKLGMIDFAGSTVVHSVGGWAGLAGAILVGPRIGKYTKVGKKRYVNSLPAHNIPFATLGVFILWVGWFGFNAGSTLSGRNPSIVTIVVNTNLAATGGAISSMIYTWIRFKRPDPSMTINGILGGLVSITAGCAFISPRDALFIGLIAGIIVVLSVQFFDKYLYVDDPVGAISVHGVCGVFGTVVVGLFSQSKYSVMAGTGEINGLFYGGGIHLFLIQILGVISVFAWAFIVTSLFFILLKVTVGLRVSEKVEIMGLDINEHGIEAYSDFQFFISQ